MNKFIFALAFVFVGCASREVSMRKPAQAAGAPADPTSTALPLYSWTNKADALADPKAFLAGQFAWAQKCENQISADLGLEKGVPGCEGNGLKAGPGVYTCDDPFTSHDYGGILITMQTQGGSKRLGDGTGLRPADDMDRAMIADSNLDGILYDFRAGVSGRAVAIRSDGLLNVAATMATDARPAQFKKFSEHPSFVCNANSSLAEVLKNWGDQIEFMSFVFFGANDDSQNDFVTNKVLNVNARVAAVASDGVAMSDTALKTLVDSLSAKYPDLQESLGFCEDTDAMTLRKCFFQRLYVSIHGPAQVGMDWYGKPLAFKTIIGILKDMKFLLPSELSLVPNTKKLSAYLADRFGKDPNRLARMQEAFNCMNVIREPILKNNLTYWMGNTPRPQQE